ncbi:Trehalose monomycolate exporter MmpL3 [Mycobacterium simulans]|uniref:Trehalose monomycolate exporter MmpL3 n=1 Tax=Mycobacterium simulans TaxID=627089 RepID=A0A7Z7IMJ4_9MYCO|nr:MMPL family transporter [Mycobacterium simulans]SOJ56373.1 Trehalose monomycolate exporter MmpL3 [Mycobacterium simulans]
MILTKLGALAQPAPRIVIATAVLFLLAAGIFGAPVSTQLPAGGYDDPGSESAKAQAILANDFHAGGMPIVFEITDPGGVDAPAARARAQTVLAALHDSRYAQQISSYWSASMSGLSEPAITASLVSSDHRTGLIVAQIAGSDSDAPQRAHDIANPIVGTHGDVTVKAGGQAIAYYDVNRQLRKDLTTIEAVAMPLAFVVLVWIFGSALAAILPIAVAVFAIEVTTAALRALSMFTSVSVFALNLASALCIALAIDYTLFIINRYREELASGKTTWQAIAVTMNTAGRTVTYSAVTVALSLVAMTIFPMYFLRSLAYAGLIGVSLCLIGALLVAPALLTLLGERIDKWDLRKPAYRLLGREAPKHKAPQETFFYRSAVLAMRYAVPAVLLVTALYVILGLPALGMKVAYPDDRMLPTTAPARQAGDTMRESFPLSGNAIRIVIPSDEPASAVSGYALRLSRVTDVVSVAGPDGTYVNGKRVSTDSYGAAQTMGASYLTVSSSLDPYSSAGKAQLADLKNIQAPAPTLFGGVAQQNIDDVNAIVNNVPLAFILIATTTLVLVFLLTGSILLPIKALVMNMLSLTAAFGAMVWIFQDGHLGGFGTTTTGHINAEFIPFIFGVAFGLSMDYEVFVLSRVREEWLNSDRGSGANERAVALGLARTGRIVTAAATVMAIVFVATITSQVQAERMLGTGLAITVLLDAFLIRTVLVPAFMRLLGRANWWAPGPLRRWHNRWGLTDEPRRATHQPVEEIGQAV